MIMREITDPSVLVEEVDAFFADSSKQLVLDILQGKSDGFPGPDLRKNRVAEGVRELLGDLLGGILEQAAHAPHGYDLTEVASRDDFMDAAIAGGVLALIDLSEEREEHFEGLFGEDNNEG